MVPHMPSARRFRCSDRPLNCRDVVYGSRTPLEQLLVPILETLDNESVKAILFSTFWLGNTEFPIASGRRQMPNGSLTF